MDAKQVKRLQSKKKLGMLVVALVVISVLALAYYYSEGTNDQIAPTIIAAVRGDISQDTRDALAERLAEYAPPDDREPFAVDFFIFPSDYADPQGEQLLALIDEMNAGQPNMYILDQQVYELLGGRVALENIATRYPQSTAVSEKSLYALAGTPFIDVPALAGINWHIALQDAQSPAVTRNAQTQEYYKYQLALLDNIVNNLSRVADSL